MDLSKALEALKYDVRMREWNIKQGVVKEKDLEENQKNLKDLAASAAPLDFADDSNDGLS